MISFLLFNSLKPGPLGQVRVNRLCQLFELFVHFLFLPKENEPKEKAPVPFDPAGNLCSSELPKICNFKEQILYRQLLRCSANGNR